MGTTVGSNSSKSDSYSHSAVDLSICVHASCNCCLLKAKQKETGLSGCDNIMAHQEVVLTLKGPFIRYVTPLGGRGYFDLLCYCLIYMESCGKGRYIRGRGSQKR